MKRMFLLGIAFVCIVAAKAQYHCTVMTSTRSTITLRATGYGKNVKSHRRGGTECGEDDTFLWCGWNFVSFSFNPRR